MPHAADSRPFPTLPRMSAPHRFRFGLPSYVYPADVLPNVEALAPVVDDIEIVLFESNDASSLPSEAAIERLDRIKTQHRLTFTVHLPIDRKLGGTAAEERRIVREQALRILALTRPLAPYAYVLHPEGIEPRDDARRRRQWENDLAAEIGTLLEPGLDPSRLCLENVGFPFEWCRPLLDRFGLSVCIDVGHLRRYAMEVAGYLRQWLPRCRVVHLHGFRGGRDHLALDAIPHAELRATLDALRNFDGVLTIEVFGFEQAARSIEPLERALREIERRPPPTPF